MMTIERWTEVDRYYANLLLPVDAALEAALRASYEAGLPPVNVSPQQGKMLMLLAQSRGAQSILEIGTLGGYSAIWLARALAGKGRVVTLEANPNHADVARINIANAGLAEMVDLRVGKALDTLPQLASEGLGPFDLIFIDADKANNTSYFEWSLKLSRRGTLIIADNVVRDGTVIDSASEDPSVQGIRRFNERVAAEPRVSATAIQTVGSKGYDGFVIALVTAD
jgi:predicted O-methyltransferase YrrM